MIPSLPWSVVSPLVVGRAPLLAALDEVLDQTIAGTGRTILLGGEAGVGKTRLVDEAKRRARDRGMAILEGHCLEPDRVLPYRPVLDLLRALLAGRSAEDVANSLRPAAHELASLLPELAGPLTSGVRAPGLDPQHEKRRLFETVTELLLGLGAPRPLLMVVEDLHWSDDVSLELLLQLARRSANAGVLVLLTYRNDEVSASLSHFLADLDRERLGIELSVARLDAAEVDAMVRSIFALPRPAPAELLHVLLALTEGNPFFVEELLKSLLSSGDLSYADGALERRPSREWRIPRTVEDAVRRRSAALPPTARRVLTLAAVIGQRFDFPLLQELAGLSDDELLKHVKALIAAQLVVEESADRFAFRHALTRQAIYVQLLVRERRTLHSAIAAAIERLHAPDLARHFEALAYHTYEGGDWEAALLYAERAGDRAQAVHAPRAAVEQFTRAIDAAQHLARSASSGLVRGRGLAYQTLGEFERARADHEAALRAAQAGGDQGGEWRSLLDLGSLWSERDYELSGDHYRRALDVASKIRDQPTLAHSLNRLGNWHLNLEQPREARRCHDRALRIFEGRGHRDGIAETLKFLGMANALSGDLMQSAACFQRAIAIFRDLGDRQSQAYSQAALTLCGPTRATDTMVPALTAIEAARQGEEALRIARDIGWRAGEAFALFNLASCYTIQGEYSRALATAHASREIAEEIEHRQWAVGAHWALGAISLDILDAIAAQKHLEQALALGHEIGSRHWVCSSSGLLASAHVAQGDAARAAAVLDAAIGWDAPAETLGQRLVWCARAEVALARGDAAAALGIADRLLHTAMNPREGSGPLRLLRLRGAVLAAAASPEARAALEETLRQARAQEARPQLWRAHAALGLQHRAQRRRDEAEREFAAARAIVQELAAGLDELQREQFLRAARAAIPPPPRLTGRRAAKHAFGGLTEREREVAALIGRGKTNREIAAALFVEEGTVATHVKHMFAKLSCSSRSQIAAWAVESGVPAPG